jgi:sporulation protein YlmC with PRC-barrel domain
MSRTMMMAAFAVMMAATMAMANAQTPPTTISPAPGTSTTSPNGKSTTAERTSISANHLMPGQIRATEMNGATVYDKDNQKLGDVKDIILDREGRVAAVVLNVGATLGMGGKYVAVSMNDIKVTTEDKKPRFTVTKSKDELNSAQAYDLTEKSGTSTPPSDRSR